MQMAFYTLSYFRVFVPQTSLFPHPSVCAAIFSELKEEKSWHLPIKKPQCLTCHHGQLEGGVDQGTNPWLLGIPGLTSVPSSQSPQANPSKEKEQK